MLCDFFIPRGNTTAARSTNDIGDNSQRTKTQTLKVALQMINSKPGKGSGISVR